MHDHKHSQEGAENEPDHAEDKDVTWCSTLVESSPNAANNAEDKHTRSG